MSNIENNFLFLIVISLFVLPISACSNYTVQEPRIIEVKIDPPLVIDLHLVAGKTTRQEILNVMGNPSDITTYQEYNSSHWIYSFREDKNIIINIYAKGKDGFEYSLQRDLRPGSKNDDLISLSFTGNILTDFNL
ncbi:MAG: hypothetical protein IJA79_01540 [Desulfovibrio sp.]|nr:hypothetical protein [Desulfovibrio sp.]